MFANKQIIYFKLSGIYVSEWLQHNSASQINSMTTNVSWCQKKIEIPRAQEKTTIPDEQLDLHTKRPSDSVTVARQR